MNKLKICIEYGLLYWFIQEIVGLKGELYFNVDKLDGTMKKLTELSKGTAVKVRIFT